MTASQLEYLTQEQLDRFGTNGYLVLKGFLESDQTTKLLERSKQLLEEFDIESHPKTKFTTSDDNHVGDEYFMTSGDKIRFFLEEDALDEQGRLKREKNKAVNKIGHALHELDPAFREVTLQNERLKSLVRDLKFHKDPVALQSMVICKQTEIGGEVPEHNDSDIDPIPVMCSCITAMVHSTFLYTDPPTALGFWFALEKCTAENGALSFLPGSHKTTQITKRFVRLPEGETGFESIPNSGESSPLPQIDGNGAIDVQKREYILETCEPGDLVIIHGSVLHKSERNVSSKTRFAYTFHMIDSPPHAIYDAKNWLQPTKEMPFSKILP